MLIMTSGGDGDVSISTQDILKTAIACGMGALSCNKKSNKIAICVHVACMAPALVLLHSQNV